MSLFFRLGAINAASSVAISAYGGHKPWDVERKSIFSTAFQLHITSAIGMMLAGSRGGKLISFSSVPGILFLAGSFLFSGVAYYRCFNNDKKYNHAMPAGGMSIIFAWFLLAFS